MLPIDILKSVLPSDITSCTVRETVTHFAPANIALIKYWGKRDVILNLPHTSSISISLGNKGATTTLEWSDSNQHQIFFNEDLLSPHASFAKRIFEFLELFEPWFLKRKLIIRTQLNIPHSAGVASSACGFAALVCALNDLCGWKLSLSDLSILARLGSGSACRSLWHGFVKWDKGINGLNSFGYPLDVKWKELCVGLLLISTQEKEISSRKAMEQTLSTSKFYEAWEAWVDEDLSALETALREKNFTQLGEIIEGNAMAMHALILSSRPSILYWKPETVEMIQYIKSVRKKGIPVYFTMDAGPNIKLLFLKETRAAIQSCFEGVDMIEPFA